MMPYLTTVWNLNITRAAAIVNVFYGVVSIMPIGMAFLVDAFIGDYWMLLLSSLAYSIVSFQNFPHFFMCLCYAMNIANFCCSNLL